MTLKCGQVGVPKERSLQTNCILSQSLTKMIGGLIETNMSVRNSQKKQKKDYDSEKPWLTMQKQLSYYKRLSQSQNTMTVIEQNLPIGGQICNYTYLGFFTKGEAATWVHVKKEEVLADKLRSWDVFKSEVEMHFFSDLI